MIPNTPSCTSISSSRPPSLRIEISDTLSSPQQSDSHSDTDSLFDDPTEESMESSPLDAPVSTTPEPASLTPPPIPGLFFEPTVLSQSYCEEVMHLCLQRYFRDGHDQVMLFERLIPSEEDPSKYCVSPLSKLPSFLSDLLSVLSQQLLPVIPPDVHAILFPPPDLPPYRARQVIINAYLPGEGVTPHVDLLDRYGDGIVGVSLGSGSVMQFQKMTSDERPSYDSKPPQDPGSPKYGIYLPPGSAYVMSGEARYDWTHGIEGKTEDWVLGEDGIGAVLQPRTFRVSVTFRWLLPGADQVGKAQSDSSDSL